MASFLYLIATRRKLLDWNATFVSGVTIYILYELFKIYIMERKPYPYEQIYEKLSMAPVVSGKYTSGLSTVSQRLWFQYNSYDPYGKFWFSDSHSNSNTLSAAAKAGNCGASVVPAMDRLDAAVRWQREHLPAAIH